MRYIDAIMQQINWDNLKYVLLIARKGSIAAAARELQVNRSTVLRRVAAFQDEIGCQIFERSSSGYVLTTQAEKLIDAAEEMEGIMFNMQRQIAGRELQLKGSLRVTTTDTLMHAILGPYLASFQQRFPHIVVEVAMTNNVLNLNRRDADVAIRPTKTLDSSLVGERVCDLSFGVYAAKDFIDNNRSEDYFNLPWIGFDIMQQSTEPAKWLKNHVADEKVCLRGDSFLVAKAAVESGMGLALLPRFLAGSSKKLQLLPIQTEDLTTGLWLITHKDLMRSAKVNAFMRHFIDVLTNSKNF